MKAFALVPNNPLWIVKFDCRWLFNWIALDIQLCFLCLPALSFLILVFFSYISSFRSSSIEIVYRCFDFLMSIKLKFGKFYHGVIWCLHSGRLHTLHRLTPNQRWRSFSYFKGIDDCVIIGICSMLLYFMVGMETKHIYKSWREY